MYKIGLSTNGKVITEELFCQYEKAGIKAMELSLDTQLYDYHSFSYEELKKLADLHNVELWSLHLPFRPIETVDVSAIDAKERQKTVSYHTEIIKRAADIGIKTFVVHCSGEPIEDGKPRIQKINAAKESMDELAEIAAREGAAIAVENLPRTCIGRNSAEILEIVGVNSKLRVCYDTNHLMSESADDFVKAVGDKIITTHISDYDYTNERHWMPGEGKINWQEILRLLNKVGYAGVWMYEIRFACPRTIIRDRDLNCEDFVRNARELFENKPITVFSKQKENLGMWE